MNRGCRYSALLLTLILSAALRAEDKDKARLFNTFYLEGDSVSWYLLFRSDRSFEIISPAGRKATGQFVASDKEIYIAGRHFQYKFESGNVTFTPTEKDGTGDGILSELPPRAKTQKTKYISQQNWQKLGHDASPPTVVAEPAPTPKDPPPVPKPLETPTTPNNPVATRVPVSGKISGAYTYGEHTLTLGDGGTFDYAGPDGRKANGTYVYVNGEITLDSGFHRRHLDFSETPGGVLITRRDTDVLKPGDALGEMPPQERSALTFKKRDVGTASPTIVPVIAPIKEPDVKPIPTDPIAEKPAPKPPDPVIKKPDPVVEKPVEKPKPQPQGQAGVVPKSLADLAGTYVFRPNPLVTETWVLKADGAFDYSDSNGAKVSGTAAIDGGVLHLKAGEVERTFNASTQGNLLVLTRTTQDNPKITNDLSTMSPSASPEAKYEKR